MSTEVGRSHTSLVLMGMKIGMSVQYAVIERRSAMRCEGYIRKGGAFTFGPVTWYQCPNQASVTIKFEQDNDGTKEGEMPACNECWERARHNSHINIIWVKPLVEGETDVASNQAR
jgi:hypothetical protein